MRRETRADGRKTNRLIHASCVLGAAVVLSATLSGVSSVLSPATASAGGTGDAIQLSVPGPITGLQTTSGPPLVPAFATTIHDYVLHCTGASNLVTFRTTTAAGPSDQLVAVAENQAVDVRDQSAGADYWVRCLPRDFPSVTVNAGTGGSGWYLMDYFGGRLPFGMILDANGTPVWYQESPSGAFDLQILPGTRTLAWAPVYGSAPGLTSDPLNATKTFNLDTQATGSITTQTPPTDEHELRTTASGTRLFLASPIVTVGGQTVIDCVIEDDDAAGNALWTWRASDHLPPTETTRGGPANYNGQTALDAYHCNSVDSDDARPNATGNLLVSMRNTDAVYYINRTTGNVVWKLGGNAVGTEQHLALTDDPADAGFFAQHDARFRAPSSPSSAFNVSLYDDHTGAAGWARGVEYSIPAAAGSATNVWEYPRTAPATSPTAFATGSFRRYGNDNVVGWGVRTPSGFTEVDDAGSVLLDVQLGAGQSDYRAVKAPASALDIATLRNTAGLTPHLPFEPRIGGVSTSKPSVASWNASRLDVFVRGSDNGLWHRCWDGVQWCGWEPLGGVLFGGPAAVSWSANRVDVFVRGQDNALGHMYGDGTYWSSWESLGGVLTSDPTVASWSANRLDVFVRGQDNGMWHMNWDGASWSGFEGLGGGLTSDPAAASIGFNSLDVFARGTEGALWHMSWNGVWSGWDGLGGSLSTSPAAAAARPGSAQVDVVAQGGDGSTKLLRYRGSGVWTPLGGNSGSAPSIVTRAPADGIEDIFLTGSDGGIIAAPVGS